MFGRRKSLRCDWLDWHRPADKAHFDGATLHSRCTRCEREIMQDSPGNWYGAAAHRTRRDIARRAYIDVLGIIQATGPMSDRTGAEEDCIRAVLRAFDELKEARS